MLKSYRVRAVGDKLVLDPAYAQQTGRLRFVGRSMTRVEKMDDAPEGCITRERDPIEPGDEYHVECWIPSGDVSVPANGEFGTYFRTQLLDGSLLPADAETAAAVGLPFSAPKPRKAE